MHRGYFKLFRKIDDWEYRKDAKVFSVWMRLLSSANYIAKSWEGIVIERGQCVTSLENLAKDCGLSVQNVRTALKKLEKSGNLTRKSTNKYTIVTICKYDEYQSLENGSQQASQQSTNNQLTTTNKDNKEDNSKEVIINNKCVPSNYDVNIHKEFENLSYEIESALKCADANMSILTLNQYQKLKQTYSKGQIMGFVYNIANYKRWHSYSSLYAAIKRYIESDININIEDDERGNNGDYPF